MHGQTPGMMASHVMIYLYTCLLHACITFSKRRRSFSPVADRCLQCCH